MIAQDFVSKLAIRRLVARPDVELVTTVSEGEISEGTGGLQPEVVARVRKEIESMADPQARPDVVRSAVHGSLRRLRADLARVRAAVIDAEVERVRMVDPLRSAFRDQGLLLVGEVRAGKFASEEPRRVLDALVSAAARRAGLAAMATAETWEQLSPGVTTLTPELYGHGADTLVAARERLAFWETEIASLIDRIAVRRLGRRRRSALVAHAKRAAVDPKARASRTASRALRRVPGAIAAARDLLSEELMGILDADSRRFEELIGQAAPVGILSELADVS
jgi:hypothetical protein